MLCIIQSRMSSGRLPDKMLMKIKGKPLLERVLERVRSANLVTKVIVATSINKEDDQIANFCNKKKIKCFRGDLKNVAQRFLDAISNEKADSFVRISGDSPLIPSELINGAIKFFQNNDCDLVTNIHPRTFPKGFSVEVIKTEAFKKMNNEDLTKDQKEHVTKSFYENAKKFKIQNLNSSSDYSHLNFSVDTKSDLEKIRSIFEKIDPNKVSWEELCIKYS